LECIKEEGSNISANIKTKKRKREDEDTDDNANNAKSRSRSFLSLFTFMETHIGRFINSIKNVFFSSPTQMQIQIQNVHNIAPFSTAEALDTIESPQPPNTESHYDKLNRNKLSLPDLVFQDLNKKGYFVGPGDVYGADYSIYTGSPSDNHSIATGKVKPEIKVNYMKFYIIIIIIYTEILFLYIFLKLQFEFFLLMKLPEI
jgi:hypothetical protein